MDAKRQMGINNRTIAAFIKLYPVKKMAGQRPRALPAI
jgi:hypothetical protein